MTIRADHAAGAAFVAAGLLIFALSGDLPTGQLSMPGAGFLPKLVAALTIILGAALFWRAGESEPLSRLGWGDGKHALMVVGITAAATALYTRAGFIITMVAMVLALLVIIERRNFIRAAIYGVAVVMLTYGMFIWMLKAPLPTGPFGF